MRWLLVRLLCLLLPNLAVAQVRFVCPMEKGIIQIRPDGAHLRLIGNSPREALRIRLIHPESSDEEYPWLTLTSGKFDTVLILPLSKLPYTLDWQTRTDSGVIRGLTCGHVIGIAGQSNAEGYCWQMNVAAIGDIRMLRSDAVWEHASEPTGEAGGGPWIVMANELWENLHDDLPIGIVNTAIGGTGLAIEGDGGRWHRNPEHPDDNSLYGRALARFRSAGSELEALCWIQGESDGLGGIESPEVYGLAYEVLIGGFEQDLGSPIRSYHLQISGDNRPNTLLASHALVREAQRNLPRSVLVGTAAGRTLQSDGLHYDATTYTAVGKMFAAALLKHTYGVVRSQVLPLIPDSVAMLDSSAHEVRGKYCFRINFSQNGSRVDLTAMTSAQMFSIRRDGLWYSPWQVWSRVDKDRIGSLLIGLISDTIALDHNWDISYAELAGARDAPLATMGFDSNRASFDTTYAVTFLNLPVAIPGRDFSRMPSPDFFLSEIQPNPVTDHLKLFLLSFRDQTIAFDLRNSSGRVVLHQEADAPRGEVELNIPVGQLASGVYWVTFPGTGSREARKFVILR